MKAVVAGINTNIYKDSYLSKSISAEGDILTITGFYRKRVNRLVLIGSVDHERLSGKKISRRFDYDVLYTVKGGGLVRAVDVILEDYIKKPALISPTGKITIVINPIAPGNTYKETAPTKDIFALWLKKDTGNFVALTKINETKIDMNKVIKFSPDEKYLFIVPSATLMSAQGVPAWEEKDRLTSPLWLDDLVLLRGVGENDAVYVFDLKTFTQKKFIDVSDGVRVGNNRTNIRVTWNPVKLENGIFTTDFIRRHPKPPNPATPCMLIVVKSDENGKILSKEITENDECEGL